MDKKGSRSVQPLTKGLGTDSKKSQDVNKVWPRGSRRREPNRGTFPKIETSRKPVPQRNKSIDKRPRPRGYCYGAVGGKEDAGLEDVQEAELGSVFVQGSKKQSINSLLNFYFAPRESQCHSKSGHRWTSTFKHKYNKEQFLQANCQFIVQESGDYRQYMNDPDALVNWDLIEQVNVHVFDTPSCPICLYPPVAAKMTRCGHIYCWSCVLHYLAVSDERRHGCPICDETVHKKDLKSVVAVKHTTFKINETITFKLMKRARGSLIAYPAEEQPMLPNQLLKVSDKNTSKIFAKLLLAGKLEVMSIIERERIELELQLAEEDCPEKCFIEQALTLLNEREYSLLTSEMNILHDNNNLISKSSSGESESDSSELTVMEASSPSVSSRRRYESINSDNFGSEDLNRVTTEDLEIPSANTGQTSSKIFYFYQAADGQHIYLQALNVRMLEHTYGSLGSCPKEITGRIVEKQSSSMTEDLRKRLRYLQHLPVTCHFEVAEICLKSPLVTRETMEYFQESIEKRRKDRQRRAREEKRREKRILEEENKKMGKFTEANIKLESHYQFPEFQADAQRSGPSLEEGNTTQRSERSTSPPNNSNINGGVSFPGSLNSENEYSGMSFAKMVSSSSKVIPPNRSQHTTVASQGTPRTQKQSESSDLEIEGYVTVPAYNQSFGDAIAMALEKAALTNDDDAKVNGKKKKKNKQKKILFATSMGYSGN